LDVLSRSLSMCFLSPLYIFSDYDIIYVSYIYLIVLPRFDSIYDNLYDIPIFQQSTEPFSATFCSQFNGNSFLCHPTHCESRTAIIVFYTI